MSIYYHDTPKPLALYRDRIRTGCVSDTDAWLDLAADWNRRWKHWKYKGEWWFWRYLDHYIKVREIAERETNHERAA